MGRLNRFYKKLINRKIAIPVVFIMAAGLCLAMLPLVNVNYDMALYLPADAGTSQAISVAKAEFDYPGTAVAMASDVTPAQAVALKARMAAVPGVKNVLWLDDVADINKPLEFIPQATRDSYYKDGFALFHLEFTEDDYSKLTSQALLDIQALHDGVTVAGNAESSRSMKSILAGEMLSIIAIVVPICVLILMLASFSWLEPALYLFVIGISVAINMGTNALFNNVSFITHSMAAVLQLAVSMDYSIFLMHRYFEERDRGSTVRQAIVNASASSMSSIAASAMTTAAGFAALLFMRYGIGADIGIVLMKGILISFATVMLLMPVMILLLNKPLERSRHRPLVPSFAAVGRGVMKLRFGIIAAVALLIVPALLAQGKNQFLYGDNSASAGHGEAYEHRQQIIERFGVNNAVMLLVPNGDAQSEIALASQLQADPLISRVTALATIADSAVAREFLPRSVVESFTSQRYSRMIVYLETDGETQESFDAVAAIRAAAQKYYPGAWLAAGKATSLADIKDTVTVDSRIVTAVSLLAVGLILLITFRSFSIPLILLLVIQTSVWINMAIPYFSSFKMAYLGYLIVSSLQLGCTIDYGILLSNRYKEFRRISTPRDAALSAVKAAGPSILISALILATAGFGFGAVSQVDSISQLGELIGRGALISGALTIVLLPSLLAALDKLIAKTTLKNRNGVLDS